jgi:predicted SAM-dependent methyltransferase
MSSLNHPLKVIIGGSTDVPGWTSMNADPATKPDILSDISELKGIEPNSVSVFYLSHVLEHIHLPNIVPTLTKLYNGLMDQGKLYISVPDLTVLMHLLHHGELDINQKIHVLRMIYGGQVSNYDFHYFGYTYEILKTFLEHSGFINIQKVDFFGIHKDTSDFSPYFNTPISLNIICQK